MQVTVETTQGLERRMTVAIPAEQVESEVTSRLKSMAHKMRVDGFRPGKVPLSVVRSRYGKQIRGEVMGELVQSSYQEALTQENLHPAGGPHIEPTTSPPHEAFQYVATFEVYPEITPAPADRIEVQRPVAEVTEEDVDTMLDRLRDQRKTYAAVERGAQEGDRVTIDYRGELEDGSDFVGNAREGMPVVIGRGALVGDFEQQLLGASVGEQRQVEVTFPEGYARGELAGKKARFAVTVKQIEEPRLPALDAEFAKALGLEDGSLETLRNQVREKMRSDLNEAIRAHVKRQVMDGLLAVNPIDLPAALVQDEMQALKHRATAGKPADSGPADAMFEDEARRRVALGLIVAEVVKQQGMQANPDKVRQYVDSAARDYEDPGEVVRWYYGDRARLHEVEMVVLEDEVVDWVMNNAKVSERPSSFYGLTSGSGE